MGRAFTGKKGTAYKSKSNEWGTPSYLFDELNEEFRFTLDVCATEANAKCDEFFSPEYDGLKQDWGEDVCFMNPPYGNQVGAWVKKAYEAAEHGAIVVCLLAARTDTRWWHEYVMMADEIRLIKGRVKFVAERKKKKVACPAPFPSAIVIFRSRRLPRPWPRVCSFVPRGKST